MVSACTAGSNASGAGMGGHGLLRVSWVAAHAALHFALSAWSFDNACPPISTHRRARCFLQGDPGVPRESTESETDIGWGVGTELEDVKPSMSNHARTRRVASGANMVPKGV